MRQGEALGDQVIGDVADFTDSVVKDAVTVEQELAFYDSQVSQRPLEKGQDCLVGRPPMISSPWVTTSSSSSASASSSSAWVSKAYQSSLRMTDLIIA